MIKIDTEDDREKTGKTMQKVKLLLSKIEYLFLYSLIMLILFSGCSSDKKYKFGVFIGEDGYLDSKKASEYELIVVDAQNFSKKEINGVRKTGTKVYTYINIGSIENFRPYYENYKNLIIGKYENWNDEFWINVTIKDWKEFITKEIAGELASKDIDGFFIDNADIYGVYEDDEIYYSLISIIKELGKYDKPMIINGGDIFVKRLLKENLEEIIDGVNQECVFTKINNYENCDFGINNDETKNYFLDYLKFCKEKGLDVYLTEYTKNQELVDDINEYCNSNNYSVYITDSLNLTIK